MVGVGPAVNTNYHSPLVWGEKSPIYMSLISLSSSVHTFALLLQGLVGPAFEWKPSSYTFASHNANVIRERKPVKVVVIIVALNHRNAKNKNKKNFSLLCFKSYPYV